MFSPSIYTRGENPLTSMQKELEKKARLVLTFTNIRFMQLGLMAYIHGGSLKRCLYRGYEVGLDIRGLTI